ncbi:MAG: hypothetical protein GY715_01950 [Planctomycetes bacterium]|nr:hypothetical protein [Planctomycetota bacterium]
MVHDRRLDGSARPVSPAESAARRHPRRRTRRRAPQRRRGGRPVIRTTLALACLLVLGAGCASDGPKRYECAYATNTLTIDGRIDEAAWLDAPWTDQFVDIEGDTKPAPRFRTRAKMLWDDEHFYVAAIMEEPHVWASLTEHDQIVYHDNDFEVFIDPEGDTRNYYEVEVNALNTIFDLLLERRYLDGGPARHEWAPEGMRTAVHVRGTLNDPNDEDHGWSVEIALPWTALGEYTDVPAPPNDGDTWRVNFSRVQWQHRIVDGAYEKVPDTKEDNWVWSPQGAINMHLPRMWGYVVFRR